MLPEIYLIADDLLGRLYIMPCPSGDHLTQDIAAYRARGVDTVVSMLAVDEAADLGLTDEGAICANAEMDFVSSPIKDFGLPDIMVFDALVERIVGLLRRGRHIAVHCRAGIGRSGMVTAAVLITMGADVDTAVQKVTTARGVSIPDTVEQGRFIANFQLRISPDVT